MVLRNNKKADISVPFLLEVALIIIILVLMLAFIGVKYSPAIKNTMSNLWGAM